ncbi:hypothetical protein KSP39_PZI011359 [Platanthera zijinensis]|uniref:Uncharacterized protein n=1 Tax=Platanthera zijinensis TaxID=2320716 RepID=A0AAP0G5N1_9ASPA
MISDREGYEGHFQFAAGNEECRWWRKYIGRLNREWGPIFLREEIPRSSSLPSSPSSPSSPTSSLAALPPPPISRDSTPTTSSTMKTQTMQQSLLSTPLISPPPPSPNHPPPNLTTALSYQNSKTPPPSAANSVENRPTPPPPSIFGTKMSSTAFPFKYLIRSEPPAAADAEIIVISPGPTAPQKVSLRSYVIEVVCISFLIVFAINFFIRKRQNELIALCCASQFAAKDSIFDKNFSLLGTGDGKEDAPLLLKEGQNVFKFYASGRRFCQGLLATMELRCRHDLISRLTDLLFSNKDTITFEVVMNDDATDHVVLAVARNKMAKSMHTLKLPRTLPSALHLLLYFHGSAAPLLHLRQHLSASDFPTAASVSRTSSSAARATAPPSRSVFSF